MSEQWLPVPGFEEMYEVSDQGRVRSLDRIVPHRVYGEMKIRGKVLSPGITMGHPAVILCREGQKQIRYVSRVVLEAFDRAPDPGEEALHRNHQLADCRLRNLKWSTHQAICSQSNPALEG